MAAGPIGACWKSGSWPDTAWQASSWAGAVVPSSDVGFFEPRHHVRTPRRVVERIKATERQIAEWRRRGWRELASDAPRELGDLQRLSILLDRMDTSDA